MVEDKVLRALKLLVTLNILLEEVIRQLVQIINLIIRYKITFLQIFNNKSLNEVPDAKNIKIIWAFMNYYLNFEPLQESIKR